MPLPRYNPLDHVPVTGIVAVTQTVVGCGIGLLLANKLGKRAQTATAVTLFSVGLVATLPVIINFFARQINRPESARGMKRRLETIRQDSGFSDSADIY